MRIHFISSPVSFLGTLFLILVLSLSTSSSIYADEALSPALSTLTAAAAATDTSNDKDKNKDKDKSSLQDADVSRFTNTIALINEFYVKPINEKKLLEDAIRG